MPEFKRYDLHKNNVKDQSITFGNSYNLRKFFPLI